MLVKMLSTEISLSTADNVSSASIVRVYNDSGADVLITRATAGAVTIGTATAPAGAIMFIEKSPTDTLAAGSAVKATSVAYAN